MHGIKIYGQQGGFIDDILAMFGTYLCELPSKVSL